MPSAPAKKDKRSPPPPMGGPFAPLPALLAGASGDVLEIGPGSGLSLPFFTPERVRTYTAIEPAGGLHEALRLSASSAGLDNKLRTLECGAEGGSLLPALEKSGVSTLSTKAESYAGQCFDTIVSIRSLVASPILPSPSRCTTRFFGLEEGTLSVSMSSIHGLNIVAPVLASSCSFSTPRSDGHTLWVAVN